MLICLITSCKSNKRELTLITFDEKEVITVKVNQVYTFEEKYYEGYVFSGWINQKGEIVEQGTHAELLRQKGMYHQLYMLQFSREQIERK